MPHDTLVKRDLSSQVMALRASSVDEQGRSVEALLTTGNPVEVFDWNEWEMIDEALLPSGAIHDEQLPLLESHQRWNSSDLLGSVRGLTTEGDNGIKGRLYFVADDPEVEKVWNKVRQGHLRDVSIGYQVLKSVTLEPGTETVVSGRHFAAGQRKLRVVTEYRIREVSVVVIGADQAAKIRAEQSPPPAKERAMTTEVKPGENPKPAEADSVVQRAAPQCDEGKLNPKPPTQERAVNDSPPPNAKPDNADYMARMKAITDLGRSCGVPQALIDEAMFDPDCSVDQASTRFLKGLHAGRAAPVGAQANGGSVAVKTDERTHAMRELSLAFCLRKGVDPTKVAERLRGDSYSEQGRRCSPLAGASKEEMTSLQLRAEAMSSWSQGRLIERCLVAAGVDVPENRLEMMSRALSSSAVQDVFTTNVQASLLVGYLEAPDSTSAGFVTEAEVENYLEAEAVDVGKMAGMRKRTRGKPADHGDLDSTVEKYSVTSYSEQFVVDEMDLINDRFGAINQRAPAELGADAARLRPDLVYSTILSNPTLLQDSKAVFHADHGNLMTSGSAMSKANIETALKNMASQYITKGKQKVRLNLRGRYVFVPTGLGHFTRELLGSTVLLITGSDSRTIGNMNALANDNLIVIEESRLDATGCWNPATEAMVTGSATNWFLASDQRKSLQVAYLRGTGRTPRLRSNVLKTNGLYGMEWDVEHSIGVKFLGYRDWLKATGAA